MAVLMETAETQHVLRCMEIWGGTDAVHLSASTPGLDLWVYSKPHDDAPSGGDVHYVSLCGGGLITRMILADVSGHGAYAAESARSLRDIMRENINRKSQSRLVGKLNRQFAALPNQRRFATAVIATYLSDRNLLTLSNAGHPAPLWFRAETGEWAHVRSAEPVDSESFANLPLGVDEMATYPQAEIELTRGDIIILYTDAFVESANDRGEMLGESGLLEMVRKIDSHEPAVVAHTLLDRVSQFRGFEPAQDDASLLVIHHNGTGPARPSLREKLDVYAKVFGLKRF